MCFVDFKKVYDSVWQKGVFTKLEASNVNGPFLDFLRSLYKMLLVRLKLE